MTKKAGANSAETKSRIMQAALDEFSEHGFQASSLRQICISAGVTTGAIYCFYSGKDELFETLVKSVTEPLLSFLRSHFEMVRKNMDEDQILEDDTNMDVGTYMLKSYFKNKTTWEMILKHPNQPSVMAYMEDLKNLSKAHYIYILNKAREKNGEKTEVDPFDVEQFVNMQLNTMNTLVMHGFKKKDMEAHARTAMKMLKGAFLSLMIA